MKLKHYLPKKAIERLQQNPNAIFVDIRSEAENKFVGRPPDCIFIPWVDEPDWEINGDKFIEAIKRFGCKIDSEIILICRSGNRSNDAGKTLVKAGFNDVAHIATGFEGDLDENDQRGNLNGWRHDGMDWVQC